MTLANVIAAAMAGPSSAPIAPPPPPNPMLSTSPAAPPPEAAASYQSHFAAQRLVAEFQKHKPPTALLIPSERAPELAARVRAVADLADAVDAEIIAMHGVWRTSPHTVAAQLASKAEPESGLAAAVDEEIAVMNRCAKNMEFVT